MRLMKKKEKGSDNKRDLIAVAILMFFAALGDVYIITKKPPVIDLYNLNVSWQLPIFQKQIVDDPEITVCKTEGKD
jgi:hypothetical protein